MIINGKSIHIESLSTEQLLLMDDALEAFFFKETHLFIRGEPFAPVIRKDKKHFRELIANMIGFKRALMKYFQRQYDNRFNLVRMNLILDDDEGEDAYIYIDNWEDQQKELMGILEEYKRLAYELGIMGLQIQSGKEINHSSYDGGLIIVKQSKISATTITDVTKKRIIQAVKDSVELGENKSQFEERLKKIMVNPYRGRFIAQEEAMTSYRNAKEEAAKGSNQFTKKTWDGVQPDKKEICGKVIGETVGINELFSNGLNSPDDTHMGCKCDIIYS